MATQTTTANKPYLRKTPTTNRYWLDGNTATANLTATFSTSLGSSCTIARLDPELGVQWSENQTIGTTFNLITRYTYHGPMLIINRALTAAEKATAERVMGRFMPQLGPELYQNPSFDTDTAWDKDAYWSIGGGNATAAPGVPSSLTQQIIMPLGRQLYGGCDVVSVSGLGIYHILLSNGNQIWYDGFSTGRVRKAIRLNSAITFAGVRTASTNTAATISGASLKEIL